MSPRLAVRANILSDGAAIFLLGLDPPAGPAFLSYLPFQSLVTVLPPSLPFRVHFSYPLPSGTDGVCRSMITLPASPRRTGRELLEGVEPDGEHEHPGPSSRLVGRSLGGVGAFSFAAYASAIVVLRPVRRGRQRTSPPSYFRSCIRLSLSSLCL